MSSLITILTPTYNRAYILKELYDSLVTQSDKDFLWLIMDDGSEDNTKELVEGLQSEGRIEITYVYGPNGGKHRALNRAIKMVSTPLTFIVDSDDRVSDDAIEIIKSYYNKYKDNPDICGYSFLRASSDGAINDKPYPEDEKIENYIGSRINARIKGDKAEVFLTHCLQEFPFSEYEGEKYIGEDTAWFRMSKKYNLVNINKIIYICDYRDDGITKSGKKFRIKSPRGGMERGRLHMDRQCRFDIRIYGSLYNITMGKYASCSFSEIMGQSPNKLLTFLTYPAGLLLYAHYRRTL